MIPSRWFLRGAAILFATPVLLLPPAAAAQDASLARVALETAAAVDLGVDRHGNVTHGVIADGVASVSLGRGFEGIVRPYVQRLGSGEWNRQIWVAALRYERSGRVALRVDGGLIPPPVGLANLTLRPHLNPTIAQPSSLFTPLPSAAPGMPRANLLGAVYPYGLHVGVSGSRWDARAAVIDASPLRARRVFARVNPPQFANVVLGAGATPVVGMRVGASITRGGWLRAGETPSVTRNASATVVTVESEVAFRHTRLAAEWVRDRIEMPVGSSVVASGWYVQGQQTLAARWFVAGRVERMGAPGYTPAGTLESRRFTGVEETVGFRLTPELTLRGGHRVRRAFASPGFEHQASLSLVWWKRSL